MTRIMRHELDKPGGMKFQTSVVTSELVILAPGLLGGSVAKAARAFGVAGRIVIWARRREVRVALAEQGWCDGVVETAEEAVKQASLVVLAAPVDRIIELAERVGPHLPEGAVVTDVGSVKAAVCGRCEAVMPAGRWFVGAHPMAGGEKTGWENGSEDLFEGKTCFVTAGAGTPAEVVAKVEGFWRGLRAEVVGVSPEEHDRIVAHISHLPQAVATALGGFLATKPGEWRGLAGNGLKDTTRIAASDATMWVEIFQQNREEVGRAMAGFRVELEGMEKAVTAGDWEEVRRRLERGKGWRDGFVQKK